MVSKKFLYDLLKLFMLLVDQLATWLGGYIESLNLIPSSELVLLIGVIFFICFSVFFANDVCSNNTAYSRVSSFLSGAFFAPLPFPELPEPEIFSNLLVLGVISVSIFGVSIFLRIRKHSFLLVALKRVFRVVTSFLRVALFGQSYLIELRYAIADLSSIYYFKFKILVLTVFSRLLFLWGVGFYLHSLGVVFYGLSWAAYIVAPVMSFVVDLLGLMVLSSFYDLVALGGEAPTFLDPISVKNGVYSMKTASKALTSRGGDSGFWPKGYPFDRPTPLYGLGSEPLPLARRWSSSSSRSQGFLDLSRNERSMTAQLLVSLSTMAKSGSLESKTSFELLKGLVGPRVDPYKGYDTFGELASSVDVQMSVVHALTPSLKSTDLGLQGHYKVNFQKSIFKELESNFNFEVKKLSVAEVDEESKIVTSQLKDCILVHPKLCPLSEDIPTPDPETQMVGPFSVWDRANKSYVTFKKKPQTADLDFSLISQIIEKAFDFSEKVTKVSFSSSKILSNEPSGFASGLFGNLVKDLGLSLETSLSFEKGSRESEALGMLARLINPTLQVIDTSYREACISTLTALGMGDAHVRPVDRSLVEGLVAVREKYYMGGGVASGLADCGIEFQGSKGKYLVELKNRRGINTRLVFQDPEYRMKVFAQLDPQLGSWSRNSGFRNWGRELRPAALIEPWTHPIFQSDGKFNELRYEQYLTQVCECVCKSRYSGFLTIVGSYDIVFPSLSLQPGFHIHYERISDVKPNRECFIRMVRNSGGTLYKDFRPKKPITPQDLKILDRALKAWAIQHRVFQKFGLFFRVGIPGVSVFPDDFSGTPKYKKK